MIASNDETQFILTDITVITGDLFRTQQSCLRYLLPRTILFHILFVGRGGGGCTQATTS